MKFNTFVYQESRSGDCGSDFSGGYTVKNKTEKLAEIKLLLSEKTDENVILMLENKRLLKELKKFKKMENKIYI